jgi:hypothetical protein
VTALQVKLIRDIAEVHEIPVDRDLALFLIGELLSGGMRGFVRWGTEPKSFALDGGHLTRAHFWREL